MITDIKTLRRIIPTITGRDLTKYEKELENAREWATHHVLGSDLYEQVKERGDGDRLYRLTRDVIGYRGYLGSIQVNDLVETDSGFAVVSDDKLVPASTARVRELRGGIRRNLSETLEYLIDAIEGDHSVREAWSKAPLYRRMYGCFLPTVAMFRDFSPFEGGALEYIDILPTLRGIVIEEIEPVVSREYSEALLATLRAGDPPGEDANNLRDLRTSLAAFYKGDISLGERCLRYVRQRIEQEPEKYPAFASSGLYRQIVARREKSHDFKPILPII